MPAMAAQRLVVCLFHASLRVNAAWQAPQIHLGCVFLSLLRFWFPAGFLLVDLKASASWLSLTTRWAFHQNLVIVTHWAVVRPNALESRFRLSLGPLGPFIAHVPGRVDPLVFLLRLYALSDVLLHLTASCGLVKEAVFEREFAIQCFPARNFRFVIQPFKKTV